MKTILVRVVAVITLALSLSACSGSAPKKEVVTAAIKKIMPVNFEIQEISPVKDMPGLYEVLVKADKQPLVLYVNSKATLVFSGSIVEIETKKNMTLEAQKKLTGK
jgi:hypothetical protein